MKILHLSDLHIGKRVHEFSMMEDQRYILQKIIEIVDREQLLAVACGFIRDGKYYALDHGAYRLYVSLWVGLFPLRRSYIATRRWLGKLRRCILRTLRRK